MRNRLFPAAIGLIVILLARPVAAHAALIATWPADGATVAAAEEIRLSFEEAVVGALSGVVVTRDGGTAIEAGAAADGEELVFPLKAPLTPGTYRVEWHAVAGDMHKIEGTFGFTVGP